MTTADPLSPEDTSFSGTVERLLGHLRVALGVHADTHVGGVARNLTEAYAREMATFYAILQHAHRSGFVDSAEGAALDNVVAILGIDRARAGRLEGKVEFSRLSPAPHDIVIPAGRRVTGARETGSVPLFETVEDATIERGQTRALVRVQEVVTDAEPTGAPDVLDPDTLTIMPRPVLGVERLRNPEPIVRTSAEETDDNLRARARTVLRESQRGTAEAIEAAVRECGLRQVEVVEREEGPPGQLELRISDPEAAERIVEIERAVRRSKAAGVRVEIKLLDTLYMVPRIEIAPVDAELDAEGFAQLADELRDALTRYAASVRVGEPIISRKLEAALYAHPGVSEVLTPISMQFTTHTQIAKHGDGPEAVDTRPRALSNDRWLVREDEAVATREGYWRPVIVRAQITVVELDLVLSLAEEDDEEALKTAVREALTNYGAAKSASAGGAEPTPISLAELDPHLVDASVAPEAVVALTVVIGGAMTELLRATQPEDDAPTEVALPRGALRVELGELTTVSDGGGA